MHFYEVLGVPSSASQEDIESAYRSLRQLCSLKAPFRGVWLKWRLHDLESAYETLRNPQSRARYDEWLRENVLTSAGMPPPG